MQPTRYTTVPEVAPDLTLLAIAPVGPDCHVWRMTNGGGARGSALLRRLLRAKDRMDAAPDEQWPVRRLAEVSGASEAHFARSFKAAFGLPPHRYLLTRPIERAKALLRDTDLPVIDVALLTGWESLGTFGRVFRDITGESPTELRARETGEPHMLDQVPHCFVSAAHRPDLTTAVSEKRRQRKSRSGLTD